jgi:3-oxoacyl-[acyl-carrier-protein] synthase II
MLGSASAFLVLEAREHAEARDRKPYARLLDVQTDQSRRRPGDVAAKLKRQFDTIAPPDSAPVSILSAATGVGPATGEEHTLMAALRTAGRVDAVRATASLFGAATSATFPAAAAIAALSLARGALPAAFDRTGFEAGGAVPERIVVTSVGMWRGEGMALLAAVH